MGGAGLVFAGPSAGRGTSRSLPLDGASSEHSRDDPAAVPLPVCRADREPLPFRFSQLFRRPLHGLNPNYLFPGKAHEVHVLRRLTIIHFRIRSRRRAP